MKNRHVEPARIGDFAGYYIWFVAESIHMRAWALRYRDEPLDITYRCQLVIAGRDDVTVDTMLDSVRRTVQTTE